MLTIYVASIFLARFQVRISNAGWAGWQLNCISILESTDMKYTLYIIGGLELLAWIACFYFSFGPG
jgi:hypothetical protein